MNATPRNKVGLWVGTTEDGHEVVVTALEVQAVKVFARDAAIKVGAQGGTVPSAVAHFMSGVEHTPDDAVARMLLAAKNDAAKAGVPLIGLAINGDQVDLVPPEGA